MPRPLVSGTCSSGKIRFSTPAESACTHFTLGIVGQTSRSRVPARGCTSTISASPSVKYSRSIESGAKSGGPR